VATTVAPPAADEWRTGPQTTDKWWRDVAVITGDAREEAESQTIDGDHGGQTTPLGDAFHVEASMTTGDAYDVAPLVADDRDGLGPKLITTGLIDPEECLWGSTTCRYLKKDYQHPRIPVGAALSKSLVARISRARRPKILVAGLSKRVECFLDAEGECVGAVSTYSIYDRDDDISRLRKLTLFLLTDDVTARFRRELDGNAMGAGSTTMKKDFLQALPVPVSVVDNNA
jgi:hypothetical protein